MIYTITFNPSLDYVMSVDNLSIGRVNRTDYEKIYPGGKGINISIMLKNLGIDNEALGFIAGFTGEQIEKELTLHGCSTNFVKLNSGLSRINVKIKSNEESEINGKGPEISNEDLDKLYMSLSNLKDGDFLVLAGSIPASLPNDIYQKIMQRYSDKDIKIIVDATGDLLKNVLEYKPFLVKPNNHELSEIFGRELTSEEQIIECAKELQSLGAQNVLISMAGDGAIMITSSGEVLKSDVPKGVLKNSVGAGDSMVAGFIAGYIKNDNLLEAFKMGVATGSASAFSDWLATKEKVFECLSQI